MKSVEGLYKDAFSLAKISEEFARELLKHQPSFENSKKSLIILAGVARYLKQQYKTLELDLTSQYEKKQLDE